MTAVGVVSGELTAFVGNPQEPARPAPPPNPAQAAPRPSTGPAPVSARKVVIEETVQCAGCGAYVSAGAEKCGHCGRPRPLAMPVGFLRHRRSISCRSPVGLAQSPKRRYPKRVRELRKSLSTVLKVALPPSLVLTYSGP